MSDFQQFQNDWEKMKGYVLPVIGIIFVASLALTSFYTVEPDEEAVVLRFGNYSKTTMPGLHFKIPFGIDEVLKVKTKKVHQEELGFRTTDTSTARTQYSEASYDDESLMLTGDLNVADVEWVIQYQISDPFKYLFNASQPQKNIRDVSESIMRRVVGDHLVTEVLTTGRVGIASDAKQLTQEVIDKYDMGVHIVTVKLQDVNPPGPVKASFNLVNSAKQEQEKIINQAEREYNKIIPEARGKAEKVVSEAHGYAEALVNRAEGDSAKFRDIYREYRQAPKITRKRIYLETMEKIFKKFEDVTIVDSNVEGLLPVYKQSIKSGN